ncbi:MAG: tetratricopeptide repeat protein [Planctomycetes bacterium]|nr:tetratricopeptide repeat protein [Planctomycetota bacterium]
MVEVLTLDDVAEVPVAEPVDARYGAAAALLDKAVQVGCTDPQVAYMLALAHKRQGKTAEARAALRKIARPDANVFLQMGLLSLQENVVAQAEQEFARAWQMDNKSFAACHNLLMSRLTLGEVGPALELIPNAVELTSSREQKRTLTLLAELLRYAHNRTTSGHPTDLPVFDIDSPLDSMTQAEERRLLELGRGLGHIDTAFMLLKTLAGARTGSAAAQEAYLECTLAKARDLMHRSSWTEAAWLLAPLAQERWAARANQAALNNLLGCCAFLTQDHGRAVTHFSTAVRLVPNDPRLHQNLALAYEFNEDLLQAEVHWTRFLELLDSVSLPVPPDFPHYLQALEFETLVRVASLFAAKEKWNTVLNYLQRAHKLCPDDADILERLFHVYNHAKQPNNARKTLDRLRALRPDDPQLDLYEIDLGEVKNLSDIERMLTEIERIMRRYPDDRRVEERAVNMVGNVIPLMGSLCDQLTQQLNKVVGQVKHLPRYQVDWSALREIMRDLTKEFQKLRRITGKCMPLVSNEEHKRIVRDLAEHIDQKIDTCRSMGG